jgi:hypothetical protein
MVLRGDSAAFTPSHLPHQSAKCWAKSQQMTPAGYLVSRQHTIIPPSAVEAHVPANTVLYLRRASCRRDSHYKLLRIPSRLQHPSIHQHVFRQDRNPQLWPQDSVCSCVPHASIASANHVSLQQSIGIWYLAGCSW